MLDPSMTSKDHHHTPEEEKKIREAALDETLAGSFPASDPPSTIPNPDEDDVLPEELEHQPKPESH